MNGSDEEKEKHGFLDAGTEFCEAHLNLFQYNTEAMAGFHECSRKLSKQIVAEVEDGSKCSLSTMKSRCVLPLYGVIFY